MDPILEVARKYDLRVIEDATESLGTRYKGRMVGALGDIACFSFNGNKLITTGGGGMIVTDNDAWAARAKYLTTQAKDDPLEYVHHEIGYNYRLTNIQAAMGVAQMEQLGEYIAAKRRIAGFYGERFREVSGMCPMAEAPWAACTYWLYTVLVDAVGYGNGSRELLRKLAAADPGPAALATDPCQPCLRVASAEGLSRGGSRVPRSLKPSLFRGNHGHTIGEGRAGHSVVSHDAF